jgi:hypothetical protein
MADLRDLEPTDDNIRSLLGHPVITVNPTERGQQCSNCGQTGHLVQECHLLNMDALLERFGNECYDGSQSAVSNKKTIIAHLYS